MRKRFMMSVAAAALIAGTGFAYAQGTGGGTSHGGAASPGGAATHGGASPDMKSTESGEMKDAQSGEKTEGAKGQRAEENTTPGQKSKSMSSGTNEGAKADSKDMKAEGHDSKMNSAQSKEGTSSKEGTTSKESMSKEGTSKEGPSSAQNKPNPTESKTTESKTTESKTTGNAATSATTAPPAEKRTEISSAIRSEKVEEVTNVNFNISVGTAIPNTVRFYPLPSRIVEIYPDWSGYEFILVHGRYIIVRPQTREIVYIIEG
jgi:Protein of unknown function (DUF1236)